MDPSLDESLTLEGMDFDHSEDVVNQEDITLGDTRRLDTISMDMDNIEQQSHNLMEATNTEVIVSDLIEEPFPFQEYATQCDAGDSSNIMIDPNKINELDTQVTSASTPKLQALLKAPAAPMSNVVTVKAAPKVTKRVLATAPPRQVAIAPKPLPKTIQYAIAPKPVTLVANKQGVSTVKNIPITADGQANTVLAQIGRQLVMVPKKIKLMSTTSSSSSAEGMLNTSASSGLQYQMTMTPDQMQLINNNKGKQMVKFIQLPSGKSGESSSGATLTKLIPANVPRPRYVMQQKTVPITSIGTNKVVQNIKIAGKNQMIAIKSSQNPQVINASQSQGNVTTKKVVISSNSGQKLMIRSAAPTSTTQTVKDAGQRTQFHPINVPGKGIQYIKLVTNQSTQKVVPKVTPSKNFVFTDSQGKVIQMTAEKVSQPSSVLIPGAGNKGVVKTIKCKKKLVRIAPISKALTQSTSQPARSSQSLLAPINTTNSNAMSASTIETPSEAISIDFNDIGDDKISNYINKSTYDPNDFSIANENDYSVEELTTPTEFDDSNLHEETVQAHDPGETIDVKPTLQSLISEAVGDDTGGEDVGSMHEVEIEFEKKCDSIQNASFMLHDESHKTHDMSNASAPNEESIIIVPGNYADKQNDSLYSDDSQSYRRYSEESKRNVPLLAVSVEAECIPYPEMGKPPGSPHMSDQEAAATLEIRPRKACNCTKSQCLKLYCDCFANGEFCNNCNCNNCHNNLQNEETRQKAIRSCLERNPNAFRPKIGKAKAGGPEIIRRHTKGCNCKRSGCLKNYCECYEAKIACTAMCKCVGCRNVEETLMRRRDVVRMREKLNKTTFQPAPPEQPVKQACSFMTYEVIEAVCQCLLAAAADGDEARADPVQDVIEEFARCLQDVITASHHTL